MLNTFPTRKAVVSTSISTLLTALFLVSCSADAPANLLASGKDFMAKNDNKSAIIQIKNALQQDARLPEARYLLGKALLASGNPVGAEVELRKALDLKYPSDQVLPLLARTMLQQGHLDKLIKEFAQQNLNSPEGKADLLTTVGIDLASLGNKQAAQENLAAALATQADFAPASIAQARMRAADGDLAGALALIEKVLAKTTDNPDAWRLKADLLLVKGETEPALAAYRKLVELQPTSADGHSAIITTLARLSRTEEADKQFAAMKQALPQHPQTIYMAAALKYQSKDFTQARELLQQLLKVAPDHIIALQLAGETEYQLKSYVQAEARLARVLQLAPGYIPARRALSMTYLRLRQPAKALSTLEPALEKIDNDTNMLSLAGEVYLQNGDIDKAEHYFSKALALAPNDAAKRTAVALTHLRHGNGEQAYGELEQIAASDAGTTADLALISTQIRQKKFDKALAAIDKLEKKQPDNPLPYYMRGRVLAAKKDMTGARKNFERTLAISPVYFPAAASLATLDLIDKQPDNARKRFEAVLVADPKHLQAQLALAELRARTGGTADEVAGLINKAIIANPTQAAPRLALIGLHLGNKNAKKALAAAQDAAAALPDSPQILDMLGRAQQAAGDTNQALSTYSKLATLQPTSAIPHLRMAEAHFAAQNKDAAMQSLRKALGVQPDLIEAQRGLIALHLAAGKTSEAVAIAKEIQQQRPKAAIGFLLEGDAHAAGKSWTEAATAYRSGLTQEANSELAIKLHGSLIAANKAAEASSLSATWLKAHPNDNLFRLALGDYALSNNNYAAAADQYRAILSKHPQDAVALNNLAWVMSKQKDPKAIEYAEQAHTLAPGQPAFMDTLAVLLAEKGDTKRALELQRKAVEAAPQASAAAADFRLNLARILIKAGDKGAARKELEALAKLGDGFKDQAAVAQLLKAL